MLDRGGALPGGASFFQKELQTFAALGRNRVLISGAADTGLLMIVISAFRAIGSEPEIVFVDQCDTTLTQNKLFARDVGANVHFYKSNILQFECDPVDVIIGHYIFNFFDEVEAVKLIKNWSKLLLNDGKILINQALYDEPLNRDTEVEGVEKLRLSLEKMSKAAANLGFSPEQIADVCKAVTAFKSDQKDRLDKLGYTERASRPFTDMWDSCGFRIMSSEHGTSGFIYADVSLVRPPSLFVIKKRLDEPACP